MTAPHPNRDRITEAVPTGHLLRADELGVPLHALAHAERAGIVERLVPGVYIGREVARHPLAEVAAWTVRHPAVVGCLLTAAAWHGLTEAFERGTWMFVPTGASPPRSRTAPVRVVQSTPRFLDPAHDAELGILSLDVHGVRVRVTGPDRTAIDLWRYPALIADEHALMALRRRAQAPDFSTPVFARLATRLDAWTRIEGILRGMLA